MTINNAQNRETRIKRLSFRSGHRGTRELDILLESFAHQNLLALTDAQLDGFERLLDANDPDVYDWLIGRITPPIDQDAGLIHMIHAHDCRMK